MLNPQEEYMDVLALRRQGPSPFTEIADELGYHPAYDLGLAQVGWSAGQRGRN